MSVHRSLVSKNTLERSRNVLTRGERILKLKDIGRWKDGDSVFGLPKTATVKKVGKRRAKKKKEEEAEAEKPAPETG
jgi:small basic protein (TIGR04137 family)